MLRLYTGSGSAEIQLLGPPLPQQEWETLRRQVARLLRARNNTRAAELLEEIPFELRDGTNGFGDEFSLLYLCVPLEKYVELGEIAESKKEQQTFGALARTVTEVGPFIRFIAVELDKKAEPGSVSNPTLEITSDVVERALSEVERSILSSGGVSGVDRVHTALHGYLRAACRRHSIEYQENAGVTQLFKALRRSHPSFSDGERSEEVGRIAASMENILDALSPLRNRATLAHANDTLLGEAEAMLVINSIRTLLHYLDAKLT